MQCHIYKEKTEALVKRSIYTNIANLIQNCVKYLRDEARLSRMTGTLLFK